LLTLPGRRRLVAGIGGMAVFPAATLLYLAVTGTLEAAFADVVLFPARHYSGIQVVVFGAFTAPHQAPAVAFFPLTFVLAGATAVLDAGALWRQPRFRASLALALVGLLGAFPRPDLPHINFTVPLACPLFALVAADLLRRLGSRLRIAASTIALAVCAVGIGYAVHQEVVPMVTGPLREVPTTRGVFVAPQSPWIDAVAALVAHVEATPRDDAFFFYPYSPMLPYLTGRRHVAALDVMVPGYTTAEQYRDVCLRVVRDAQWVVIDRSWTDPRVLRMSFPGMRDPDPPGKRGLEAALRLAFGQVVHAWRGFELRRRAQSPSETVCGSI
jgi:hypothetical protein